MGQGKSRGVFEVSGHLSVSADRMAAAENPERGSLAAHRRNKAGSWVQSAGAKKASPGDSCLEGKSYSGLLSYDNLTVWESGLWELLVGLGLELQ